MARYTVQMTFETPGLPTPISATHRLTGRASSMRLLGAHGVLAVSASRVSARTPAEAAMAVVAAVHDRWPKSQGALVARSWSAHPERVLAGARRGYHREIQFWN